jgi:hypothetical protein
METTIMFNFKISSSPFLRSWKRNCPALASLGKVQYYLTGEENFRFVFVLRDTKKLLFKTTLVVPLWRQNLRPWSPHDQTRSSESQVQPSHSPEEKTEFEWEQFTLSRATQVRKTEWGPEGYPLTAVLPWNHLAFTDATLTREVKATQLGWFQSPCVHQNR